MFISYCVNDESSSEEKEKKRKERMRKEAKGGL
jgi:hypothetical protein